MSHLKVVESEKNMVRITIDLDLNSGDYEFTFKNVSNPGEGIDYMFLQKFMKRVFTNVDEQVEATGIDSNENVIKEIH